MQLVCGSRTLDLSTPVVMGVLNVTPDSFSDGGRFFSRDAAIAHARRMAEEGAALIDVGGESTRPGANAVPEDEELRRVVPVVEALAGELSVPISVDTSRPAVMRAALAAGATMINDIRAFRGEGALEAVARSGAALCLMHMQGEPRTMQVAPHYEDVVVEVRDFLRERVATCTARGIARERLVVDAGFGFGKTFDHNVTLLSRLAEVGVDGVPTLVGLSRKSMIGTILGGRVADERLHGSVALATIAVLKGAHIVRAHDVGPTVDAVRIAAAVARGGTR